MISNPFLKSPDGTTSASSNETRFMKGDESVLVVDDEENLLVLLDRVLSKEGYQVKTATDAYEALEFFDQTDIAVALLDIRMHPIDGIALLVEIKKRSPSTHVIMISSRLTTET